MDQPSSRIWLTAEDTAELEEKVVNREDFTGLRAALLSSAEENEDVRSQLVITFARGYGMDIKEAVHMN